MSLKETIIKSVTEYLESTSIHGFGYLSTGRNIIEKLLWLIIICTCFTLAALLIRQSIEEASLNPVMTNVETVQVQEVPFPAITIDIGDPDPMGYAENILNGIDFTQKDLQDKFAMEVDEMILNMNNSFKVENGADPQLVLSKPTVQNMIKAQTSNCLNSSHAQEWIDGNLIQMVKSILYEGQVYKNVLEEVTNNITIDFGVVNKTSGINCGPWARHLLTFLHYVEKIKETKNGFGTLLNYLDSKFGGWGKRADFVAKYSKVHVSKELSDINTSSFELITWLSPTLDYHRPPYWIFTTMNHICAISFMEMLKVEECQNSMEFRESHKQCCDSFTFESLNMTNLLLVFRESLQPPTFYISHQEIIDRQNETKKVPFDKVEKVPKTNPSARIFACDFADEKGALTSSVFSKMKNCTYFHRSITNKGFGISFNLADFWTMFKETPFTKSFASIMNPKGKENPNSKAFHQTQDQLYLDQNIIFPERAGKGSEMIFILQAKWHREMNLKPFVISVHDPMQAQCLKNHS